MSGLSIDVLKSPELQSALVALRALPKTITTDIRKYLKSEIAPLWKEELASNATTVMQQKVLVATATVAVTNQNITLKSATKGRPLQGGLDPKTQAAAVEFGGDRGYQLNYPSRSRKGKTYRETRHTQRQLGPRTRAGKVVHPAAKNIVPRAASLMIQTAAKSLYDALEGKSS